MQRGHKVTILSGIDPSGEFASPNTIGTFPIPQDLRQRSLRTLLSRAMFAVRLLPVVRDFARRWRPDVIHTVPPVASEAALRAGRTLGVPVVASILSHVEAQWRVLEANPLRASLLRTIERLSHRRPFTRLICLTKHSLRILLEEGIPSDRVVYVPHAVDTELFHPGVVAAFRTSLGIPSESFVIGYAGALTRDKGVDRLLLALTRLRHNTSIHLLLAGEGPERRSLERMVKALGLRDVTFLGVLEYEEMPRFMASLDLYVIPSYTETLPTTILEALATATPVMATAVGGVEDFLREGVGIVLSSPDPQVIAEAIDFWVNRRDELKRMGQAGRQLVVTEHSWERTSLQTEEVYRQCLQGKER